MTRDDEVDAFLAEVAARPKFRAAMRAEPVRRQEELDGIERALRALYLDGNNRAFSIALYDRVRTAVFKNKRISMKNRLMRLSALLAEWKPEAEPRSVAHPARQPAAVAFTSTQTLQ